MAASPLAKNWHLLPAFHPANGPGKEAMQGSGTLLRAEDTETKRQEPLSPLVNGRADSESKALTIRDWTLRGYSGVKGHARLMEQFLWQ